MKEWKITYSLDKVHEIREELGDLYTPVDELVRPRFYYCKDCQKYHGIKAYIWANKIKRLKYHETRAASLFKEGLTKYMNQKRD